MSTILLSIVFLSSMFVSGSFGDKQNLWVNSRDGVDVQDCGTNTAPCKTLLFTLQQPFNFTDSITISAQNDIQNEQVSLPASFNSPVNFIGIGSISIVNFTFSTSIPVSFTNFGFTDANLTFYNATFTQTKHTRSTFLGTNNFPNFPHNEAASVAFESTVMLDSRVDSHAINTFDSYFINSPITLSLCGNCVEGALVSTLSGSTFNQSTGKTAVSIDSRASKVVVEHSIFAHNEGYHGGAIAVGAGATVTVSNSQITFNKAYSGGGIHALGSVYLEDSVLCGNVATQDGGGLYFGGNSHVLQSTLINNVAQSGAGAYAGNQAHVVVNDTTFRYNTATQNGGGIAIADLSTVVMGDCLLESQEASQGGAIFVNGATLVLAGESVVQYNRANSQGAGIHAQSTELYFNDNINLYNNSIGDYAPNEGFNMVLFEADLYLVKSSKHMASWSLNVTTSESIYCDDCEVFCPAASNCSDCSFNGTSCITMGDQAMCTHPPAKCKNGGFCTSISAMKVNCHCVGMHTNENLCQTIVIPALYMYAGLGIMAVAIVFVSVLMWLRMRVKERTKEYIYLENDE